MARLLIVGSEKLSALSIAAQDTISKSLQARFTTIVRHPLSKINLGTFVDEMRSSTHMLIVLDTRNPEALAEEDTKLQEIANQIDDLNFDLQISVMFLDKDAVRHYQWLLDEAYSDVAIT